MLSVCATKRPLIEVKLAQTIDGYSADSQHSSQWISDPGAIKFAHHIRARHDAILIGGRTALHDNPRLTARFGLNAYPIRIVLDRQMALPLSLKLFSTAKKVDTYLIHDEKTANEKKMHQLAKMGVHVVGFDMDAEDFYSRLFGYFYTHTICNSILVEGGALTVSRIVERGIWDRISMVLCPMLLLGGVHMRGDSAWQLSETKKIDKSIWYSLTHFNSQCMAFRGYKKLYTELWYWCGTVSGRLVCIILGAVGARDMTGAVAHMMHSARVHMMMWNTMVCEWYGIRSITYRRSW